MNRQDGFRSNAQRGALGVLALLVLVTGAQLLRAAAEVNQAETGAGPAAWIGDLTPIAPPDWTGARAAHLLERAGFGGTPEEIARLAKMTPQEAVRHLVHYQQVEKGALPPFDESGIFLSKEFVPPPDGGVGIREAMQKGEALGIKVERKPGTPWLQPIVNEGYYLRFANNLEITRVARWFAQRMLLTQRPLEEKLALFWHGHFATENDKVRDYRKMMAQWDLYRQHGAGNLKDLLVGISRDPAMLIYLDGLKNVRGKPNENYAREILELFALGDGNYTEQDIKEASRAFSGWGLDGNTFAKHANLHDNGSKTFLGQTGNLDGEDIVDTILKQPACARFISRKLYTFFVRDDLPADLGERLADVLRTNNYEIAPLLETMFLSRDFYSPASYAMQIKSPVHLVVSTYKKLGLTEIPGAPNFNATTQSLGQQLCRPPNVAGWKGGRAWINPSMLIERQNFARYVLFPRQIPPPTRKRMDFVGDIIGERVYQQLNAMAKQGDFTSFPKDEMDDSGFNRRQDNQRETYNIFRGVYNGAIKTLQKVKFDPPTPAKVSLIQMIRAAGVTDAAGTVDYLARRFLRVAPPAVSRQDLIEFLTQRLGGSPLDFQRDGLETDLRELLHLILCLPEYQLA
jgi:hypothetical protein